MGDKITLSHLKPAEETWDKFVHFHETDILPDARSRSGPELKHGGIHLL